MLTLIYLTLKITFHHHPAFMLALVENHHLLLASINLQGSGKLNQSEIVPIAYNITLFLTIRASISQSTNQLFKDPVPETLDWIGYVDPNEPRYCLCNQVKWFSSNYRGTPLNRTVGGQAVLFFVVRCPQFGGFSV